MTASASASKPDIQTAIAQLSAQLQQNPIIQSSPLVSPAPSEISLPVSQIPSPRESIASEENFDFIIEKSLQKLGDIVAICFKKYSDTIDHLSFVEIGDINEYIVVIAKRQYIAVSIAARESDDFINQYTRNMEPKLNIVGEVDITGAITNYIALGGDPNDRISFPNNNTLIDQIYNSSSEPLKYLRWIMSVLSIQIKASSRIQTPDDDLIRIIGFSLSNSTKIFAFRLRELINICEEHLLNDKSFIDFINLLNITIIDKFKDDPTLLQDQLQLAIKNNATDVSNALQVIMQGITDNNAIILKEIQNIKDDLADSRNSVVPAMFRENIDISALRRLMDTDPEAKKIIRERALLSALKGDIPIERYSRLSDEITQYNKPIRVVSKIAKDSVLDVAHVRPRAIVSQRNYNKGIAI